jgi:hypothetical protein
MNLDIWGVPTLSGNFLVHSWVSAESIVVLGEKRVSLISIDHCIARFRDGDLSYDDQARSERPIIDILRISGCLS